MPTVQTVAGFGASAPAKLTPETVLAARGVVSTKNATGQPGEVTNYRALLPDGTFQDTIAVAFPGDPPPVPQNPIFGTGSHILSPGETSKTSAVLIGANNKASRRSSLAVGTECHNIATESLALGFKALARTSGSYVQRVDGTQVVQFMASRVTNSTAPTIVQAMTADAFETRFYFVPPSCLSRLTVDVMCRVDATDTVAFAKAVYVLRRTGNANPVVLSSSFEWEPGSTPQGTLNHVIAGPDSGYPMTHFSPTTLGLVQGAVPNTTWATLMNQVLAIDATVRRWAFVYRAVELYDQ